MTKIIDSVKKNLVLSVCFMSFIILFVVMTYLGSFKKGTFSLDEDEDRVIINCPSVFVAGEVVECNISLSLVDDEIVYSINANYDFADGITYESFGVDNTECTGESCLEALETTENGFAVINLDGISQSVNIGRLRVKMPNDAVANTSYRVGLKNIEFSYGDNIEMKSISNTFFNLRVKNNVATLSALSIDDVNFNETFNSSVFNYEASVPASVDSLNINYELTDTNATVSGNIGEVNVHYGTNIYNIIVTSEDGKVVNTYKLNVYREYKFSTNKYLYNEDGNYIYTGADNGDTIISNLELLNDNISYNIRDGKLYIIYGDNEELLSIDIISFSTIYNVVNDKIYLANNLTYQQLLDTITSEDIVFKLFNSNDVEIDDLSTIVLRDYKLLLYYNDMLLDTYTLIPEYLHIDNSLVVDNDDLMIKRIKVMTTVSQLKNLINTSGSLQVTANGTVISDDKYIKSGDKLDIDIAGMTITYTLSVLGDVSGDGIIDIDDVGKLYRYFRGKETLDICYIAAGEITADGIIDIDDVGRLYRYFRGKETSLEV